MDERIVRRPQRHRAVRPALCHRPLHRRASMEPYHPQASADDILLDFRSAPHRWHRTAVREHRPLDQQQHCTDDNSCDTDRNHSGIGSSYDFRDIICGRSRASSGTACKQHLSGWPCITSAHCRKQEEFSLGQDHQLHHCIDSRICSDADLITRVYIKQNETRHSRGVSHTNHIINNTKTNNQSIGELVELLFRPIELQIYALYLEYPNLWNIFCCK